MVRAAETIDDFRLLKIDEVAQRLSCSEANVYDLIASGELPVVRVGRQKGYRVDIRDLDAFVSDRKFRYQPAPVRMPKPKLKHLRA
jgi:excisionase family DNA binding protein